jgi:hypothetical protein
MHQTFRRSVAVLALLAAHGLAAAAIDAVTARDVVRKSGLRTQLASVGAQMRAGMDAGAQDGKARLDPAQRQLLGACAQAAFAVDRMRATAVDAVAGALSPADLPPLMAWYDSDIGRKVTAIEEAAAALTGDPRERLRIGGEKLAAASAARQASLHAVLDNTHGAQRMVDMMIEVTLAVQQGVASVAPEAAGPPAGEMRAVLEQQRPQLTARYAQVLLQLFAFDYAALSDDELRRYADSLGSPAGSSFSDAAIRAVVRALQGGSVQLGRCIQEARTTRGS